MILFLDFDGVVTPLLDYHTGLHMARLPLLEDVLRMRPEVKIVISSTWRNTRSFTQLQKFFSPDISSRIIGMTPHWRDVQDETTFGLYVRQAEIESWLRFSENPWQTWLALDDQAHLFRPFCPNLMLINPNKGLTEDDCEALLSRLLLQHMLVSHFEQSAWKVIQASLSSFWSRKVKLPVSLRAFQRLPLELILDKRVYITAQGVQLVATLWDGSTLRHQDAENLSDMLVEHGISVDQVHMPDWREGDISPTTGQKVAILLRMRNSDGSSCCR